MKTLAVFHTHLRVSKFFHEWLRMSKILQCLGWKKKHKYNAKIASPKRRDSFYIVPRVSEINRNDNGDRESKVYYRRTLESTHENDPLYLENLYRINDERKVKSYPASPKRTLPSSKRCSSDPKIEDEFPIKQPTLAYFTSVPNKSPMQKPNEQFPFQIPDDPLPRRSSMFYGVKYDNDMFVTEEVKKHPAEKPIEEYYSIPSTSKDNNYQPSFTNREQIGEEDKAVRGKRVTITMPNEMDELANNDKKQDVARTTIVRFRPQSSGSFIPGESVKKMTLRAEPTESHSLGKNVRNIPLRNSKEVPVLTTVDGRPILPIEQDKITRRSLIQEPRVTGENVEKKPQRESIVYVQPPRESIVVGRPLRESQMYAARAPQKEKIVYAKPQREFINRGSIVYVKPQQESIKRQSIVYAPPPRVDSHHNVPPQRETLVYEAPVTGRRTDEQPRVHSRPSSVEVYDDDQRKDGDFPYARDEQNVYAVPVIPTRGRSRSILQQSVRSLTSKNQQEVPVVHRKNIRYSMDTDVLSTNVRRRSVQQAPPGYVNMERGNTVLVADVLNPITSLFVSDLKDPVPKDPLTYPKEANVWVKPRTGNGQRQSIVRPRQSVTRIRPIARPPTRAVPVGTMRRRQCRSYRPYGIADSDSEDSFEVYRKKSRRSFQKNPRYQQEVYVANIPDMKFPVVESSKNPPFKKKGNPRKEPMYYSTSKDYCGISDEPLKDATRENSTKMERVPSGRKSDTDDEMDLLCYPSEKFLKNTAKAAESGSKLRWKIIIKRGEEG